MDTEGRKTDDVVGSWAAILRIHARLVPQFDRELQRRAGMSLSWYDVLLELNAAPGQRLRMLDLGEVVVLSRTRVSRVVDELVAAGFVRRLPNPVDRRSAYAELTPAGRSAFRSAAPVYLDSIRRGLGERLRPRDASELRRILERALGPT